jgi:hypothetical protein
VSALLLRRVRSVLPATRFPTFSGRNQYPQTLWDIGFSDVLLARPGRLKLVLRV